jgi:peptide deformylase
MEILCHPSPVLKQRAAEVDPSAESDLPELSARMARMMYDAPGLGLAAPQVGVQKRLIVYDIDEELVTLCNPRVTRESDETILDEEGCLSFPGITIDIERPASVTCEATTLDGTTVTIDAEGLHARLILHEIDHLDGVLIIDRATDEERKAALRRYREAHEVVR